MFIGSSSINRLGYFKSYASYASSYPSQTFALDGVTADSASTSTAYLCGVKTNIGMIGLAGAAQRGDCAASLEEPNQVESLIAWAQANDMWTGEDASAIDPRALLQTRATF